MEELVNIPHISSFYQNKKVFITGHTGFKGAWLMAALHRLGANIAGYALAPEQPGGLYDFLQPLGFAKSTIADIRDFPRLQQAIGAFNPDIVFHLAAQPLVRRSYQLPAETFDINVVGTANLLDASRKLSKKCALVVITTDKVYHNRELDVHYQEDDRLGGYDPYSASKACCELVADSFRNSFFNVAAYSKHQKSLSTVRAGNVIGGGDWSTDRLLPDIVQSLSSGKPILVRNPRSVRPWQHVLEAVSGYLVLGRRLYEQPDAYSKSYNFGPVPADHLAVSQLVEKAISCWGSGEWRDVSDAAQPHEAELLKLDISRAQAELDWVPRLNAATAIQWTIDWYKKPAAEKADFTFGQINDYFHL